MAKIKPRKAMKTVEGGATERACPPGGIIYEAKVVELLHETRAVLDAANKPNVKPRLVIIAEIVRAEDSAADDEQYNGYRLWGYFPYDEGTSTWSPENPSAWKVKQMLDALYDGVPDEIDTDKPSEANEFKFKGRVEPYKGKDRLKIDMWLPLEADVDEPVEDEEPDEEPAPKKTTAKKAPAKAKVEEPEEDEPEDEEESNEEEESSGDDGEEDEELPDYPEWSMEELEEEIEARQLQLSLPKGEGAKKRKIIEALKKDDEEAENPLD
jgi:hypothetical protein